MQRLSIEISHVHRNRKEVSRHLRRSDAGESCHHRAEEVEGEGWAQVRALEEEPRLEKHVTSVSEDAPEKRQGKKYSDLFIFLLSSCRSRFPLLKVKDRHSQGTLGD